MTLTEFLLARIAEDEAEARKAPIPSDPAFDDWMPAMGMRFSGEYDEQIDVSPWRVLAECDAKRRIIELHADTQQEWNAYHTRAGGNEWLVPVLRLLAVPYADHPDYREEWKP